jgi:hypothetical protein
MGVPNVTLGEGDSTVQTATGATLVNQRASGLLVPAKKSEGDMKAGWLKDQLDLIQTFYSPEALLAYGSRYGKEFLEDEINAFFSCKLDDAITIEIVDGSEIPETRSDKQMKLRNDIAAGFIPLTPELQMKLAQQSGYDGIDVNYYESNCKLAEKRMAFVKENYYQPEAEMQYQQAEAMLTDPKTGQRLTDEMGNKVPNPITQMAISNPALKPNAQAENHEQQFQYWAGMTRELLASGSPVPMVVVDICDAMMSAHKFAAFAEQTKAQTMMGLSQMPVQMGGALAMQAVAPPEPKENNSEKSSKKT